MDNTTLTAGREKRKKGQYGSDNIIKKSQDMVELYERAMRIAESKTSTILIQGEIGTGKEFLAREIHYHSLRRKKPFIVINCNPFSGELFEIELFGYEKRTCKESASQKTGELEMSDGGTIFFDEIGDVDIRLQQKILRVIEEKQFEKPGSRQTSSVDVRIIAATRKDLEEAVRKKSFMKELYHRLRVIPLSVPPLRERKEDIPLLAEDFLRQYNWEFKKNIKGFSFEALKAIKDHPWTGNIKELKNFIEKIVLLKKEGMIEKHDFSSDFTKTDQEKELFDIMNKPATLDEMERLYMKRILKEAGGNKSLAARILGITRHRLKRKLNNNGTRNQI